MENNIPQEVAKILADEFSLSSPEIISLDELKQILAAKISHLIDNNFEQFIFLLYRLDINEKKVKNILSHPGGGNPSLFIAGLIIERQLEKARSRAFYRNTFTGKEEEKW